MQVDRGADVEERSPLWLEFKVPLGHPTGDLVSPWECEAGAQKAVCVFRLVQERMDVQKDNDNFG